MAGARNLSIVVALAAVLGGCAQSELYSGLSEREANEMVALLQSSGIDSSKTTKDAKTWTVSTPKSEFADAVVLLDARNYPREKFDSLGEVFRKQGFVSSPVEEHARLIYGLSQELSDTLSRMDGVVSARVHIALPESDPLSDAPKPSSASVFIKYDPQVDLSSQVGSIKSLVVNAVEGLPYDRVTVVLTPGRPLVLPARKNRPAPLAASLALFGGLCAAGLGVVLWRRRAGTHLALPSR